MRFKINKTLRVITTYLMFFMPQVQKTRVERFLRGREEYHKLQAADLVFVSFGKSGRTWVRVLLSRYYALRFDLPGHKLLGFENFHRLDRRIPRILFTHDNFLADYTGHQETKADYYGKKVILLVRNPQDIAVSQYFQLKFRMKEHKRKLNGYPDPSELSIYRFVMDSSRGLEWVVDFLNTWAREAPALEDFQVVRYEDLRKAPESTFAELIRFIDGSCDEAVLKEAIEYASVDNMRRLEAGQSFESNRMRARDVHDPNTFKVRRAKVGGYRDYFDGHEIKKIDELVASKLASSYLYTIEETSTSEAQFERIEDASA